MRIDQSRQSSAKKRSVSRRANRKLKLLAKEGE